MSTATALQHEATMTLQEYLAFEDTAILRHEFHDGHIYAMAGGSPAHARVGFNVCASLCNALKGHRCWGSSGDQGIRIEAANSNVYPDAVVICPPERYSEEAPNFLLNPSLIVEVLSPTTAQYDRDGKFDLYSQIPELRDYLLISQERIMVEHFQRAENGGWLLHRFNEREALVPIPNLEIELPLAEIYDGLDVPSGLWIWGGEHEQPIG